MNYRGTEEQLKQLVFSVTTAVLRGEDVKYKPLLVLWLIHRASLGHPREVSFCEVEPVLKGLMARFTPSGAQSDARYPFWHLKNDGFWCIKNESRIPLDKYGKRPLLGTMREFNVKGSIPETYWQMLVSDAELRAELVDGILHRYWKTNERNRILTYLKTAV